MDWFKIKLEPLAVTSKVVGFSVNFYLEPILRKHTTAGTPTADVRNAEEIWPEATWRNFRVMGGKQPWAGLWEVPKHVHLHGIITYITYIIYIYNIFIIYIYIIIYYLYIIIYIYVYIIFNQF